MFSIIHYQDSKTVESTVSQYVITKGCNKGKSAVDSWNHNWVKKFNYSSPGHNTTIPPFVYDKILSENLKEVRLRFNLDTLRNNVNTEFDAIIKTGVWIGSLWNHGRDSVPGGRWTFRISELIDSGLAGKQFWCEITARATVQIATAMGWPARLVTLSRNGIDSEHGVAEIYTNTFGKWFLLDTDFNCVFYSNSIPLSAFELCHYKELGITDTSIKQIYFTKIKKGIKEIDLLPYLRYIQIDLRNDWYNRRLPKGSPVGGDFSTWWTSRNDLPPQLTVKRRVDNRITFDWHVNVADIYLDSIWQSGSFGYGLSISFGTYSPYFENFIYRIDDGYWNVADTNSLNVKLTSGEHRIESRIITSVKDSGSVTTASFSL